MSCKINVTIVCSIILLISSNLNATETASKIPLDTKAIKEIIKEVDNLASNDVPASIVFAKELVKVLSKYNVSVPEKLAGLKVSNSPMPEPNEYQLEQLYETSNKISSTCRDSTWIKDPNYAVPVSLRNDLLVTMVNSCPHSIVRLEAARWLVERTFPNDEKPEYKSDVPYKLADAACISAINHVLSIPPKDDGVYFMSLAFGDGLTLNHVMLADLIGEQPEKEVVDKILSILIPGSKLSGSSGNKERTIVSFPITLLVTKEDGAQIEKTLESVTAVKRSHGWQIGSE